MNAYETQTSNKSRDVALILCMLGGLVGAHYFYVGRFWRGIICALTLNFLAIGFFVDLYRLTKYRFRDDKKRVLAE